MLLAIYAFSTDCFELQSFAAYLSQRYKVQFQAQPSKKLTGNVKNLCEQVIKQQTYDLYIKLGNVTFLQTNLTYDPNKNISIEVPCADVGGCTQKQVAGIQTATYELSFTQLDLSLSSIVNTYELRKYVHTDCMRSVGVYYNASMPQLYIQMLDEVEQCPSNMLSLTTQKNFSNGTEIQNNVYVETILNGQSIRVSKYPQKGNWSNRFTFRNNSISNSSSNLTEFWKNIQTMGPYDQSLPIMSELLNNFKNEAILKLEFKIYLLTELLQVRGTNNMPNTTFYYEQIASFYITELKNVDQPTCYSSISIEMHRKFFVLQTTLQEDLSNCTRQFIEQTTHTSYNQIRFMVIVSQNKDKTGYNYNYTFNIPNFEIGNTINEQIPCLSEEDCANFSKIIDLQNENGNLSMLMKMLYLSNGQVTLAAQYNPNFTLSPFGPANISLLNSMICIDFQPLTIGSSVIIYTLYQQQFKLSQYTNLLQTQYCSELSSDQQGKMQKIITKMSRVLDSSDEMSLVIDNKIIGQIKTIVYDVPSGTIYIWIVVVVLAVSSGIGSTIIALRVTYT